MFSLSSAQSRPQGLVQWSLLVMRVMRCGRWDRKSWNHGKDQHPATGQIHPCRNILWCQIPGTAVQDISELSVAIIILQSCCLLLYDIDSCNSCSFLCWTYIVNQLTLLHQSAEIPDGLSQSRSSHRSTCMPVKMPNVTHKNLVLILVYTCTCMKYVKFIHSKKKRNRNFLKVITFLRFLVF